MCPCRVRSSTCPFRGYSSRERRNFAKFRAIGPVWCVSLAEAYVHRERATDQVGIQGSLSRSNLPVLPASHRYFIVLSTAKSVQLCRPEPALYFDG